MKKLTFIIALAGTLLSSSIMQAAPMISLSVQEGALPALTVGPSSGSVVSINNGTTYGDFTIESLTGSGSPLFAVPYLDLSTFDVTTSLTSSATLTIMLTETGLTLPSSPLPVSSAFIGILSGVTSETISSYYDASNTAYGTANSLGTTTFTAAGSNSTDKFGTITAPGLVSETEIIVATFAPTGGLTDSLNSSALITSTAPEPVSMGVVGAGLFGVGLIGFRRRKKS
ncbi:MAG TPA: PEP-CTERM sorting domain-containing protein [Bryobacteraceae bacterium]|nr:PEP-CTERM sorting domain-containing protein [Bryobacteraceae bacterium]